ncbi:MAG: hypothetical protein WC058_06745 [Phycisphaeraceae bacterium]
MHTPRKTPFEVLRDRSPAQQPSRLSHRPAEPPPASVSPISKTSGGSGGSGGKPSGGGGEVRLRLSHKTIAFAAVLFIALIIITFELGRGSGSPQQQTNARSTQKLNELRQTEVNALLLRTDTDASEPSPKPGQSESFPGASAVPGSSSTSSDRADPRVPGYNYFCLATMPPRYRAEADRAVAFLQRNRVDAAVFSVDNHWLQVVALRGFDTASSPQAKDYQSLLRSLGRSWKAEHRGWSDWSDLYAVKYQP